MGATSPPVLALDIGGTKLAAAVVTADGRTHSLRIVPTRREQGPDTVITRLLEVGRRVLDDVGTAVAAVGVACGGPLDATSGVLLRPPHLPGWVDVPIGNRVSEAFGVPSSLENDATAAALAEHRFGTGRGTSTMVYLTVSTGVGGGVVVHGRLHRGAALNGGELGHLMVRRGGRRCTCGRTGCVEAYAAGSSIAERAAEALASGADGHEASLLRASDTPTAEDIARAARAGDPLARSLWADAVDALGSAVTDLVNVFEPELVVLGGGVVRSGEQLLAPVRRIVADEAMGPAGRAVRIRAAALGEEVCVVGAAAVAQDMLEDVRV
ncbi:ROK family protein [Georgenia halophila]|uniref:ROK family protein n=1 Tax=Georgenia halophila TaxID=620889 RepID=A0ABP8L956_9MICO